MNQERDDLVATYLGLQGFAVVAVVHARHRRRGRVKVVRVEQRAGPWALRPLHVSDATAPHYS